jgi:predicted nucleotidyltransferase
METEFDKIYQFAPAWLRDRTILLTKAGSKAYGTDDPNSDTDYRGIVVPPHSMYLSMDKLFESYHTPEMSDPDAKVYGLKRYFQLAMKNNPETIEILWTSPEDIVKIDPFGRELIDCIEHFLSQKVRKSFIGYAQNQIKKAKQNGGKPNHGAGNIRRQAEREEYGYDPKNLLHTIRILREGKEILSGQGVIIKRPDRDGLLQIKNGCLTFEEIEKMADELTAEIDSIQSDLPEEPDYEFLNQLLIDLTGSYHWFHG